MKTSAIVAVVLLLTGCATDPDRQNRQVGTAVGAVAGAVFGQEIDGKTGRIVGAAIGAIAGHAVGTYMDEQQRELEAQLEQEQATRAIQISRLPDDSLKLDLDSQVSFDFDSAALKPQFQRSLDKVASVVADYPSTALHISGHTDNVGSDDYNQGLSLRRAASVNRYLIDSGVTSDRTRVQGYGETRPVSANSTPEGRQRNRRVEIILKPIVKGDENRAFRSPI